MKRLFFPVFLILASLVTAAVFTAITAMTLASYSKEEGKPGSEIKTVIGAAEQATVQR